MTLDREHITVASRIMLPTYVALVGTYGIVYLFDPLHRLASSHSLDFPRAIVGGSMQPWGALFLSLAACLWVAFHRGSRSGYILGLCMCASAWLGWAVLYTVSVFTDPHASILAPIGPLFYFAACIATSLSLMVREV